MVRRSPTTGVGPALDTGEHGTDILAYADVAAADAFRQAVLDFLARI